MAGKVRLMLILLLGGALTASRLQAQTADSPAATDSAATPEPEFVKTLPRPPDQPASLFAPAPPLGPPPPSVEQPYFQVDPLVNPPELGAIGWFTDIDIGFLKPHLVNEENLPVTFPDGSSTNVFVNASRLNWTVSPRFEVGYRLPTGFGGLALSYRNISSTGSEQVVSADGFATLSSRLNANIVDLDWVSNEFTRRNLWEMRVRFGVRYLNVYYDSQAVEPFYDAAMGTTFDTLRTTDSTWAIGPHAAFDVRRRLNFWGLAVVGFLDVSDGWSRLRQNYFATSTTSATGFPQAGQFTVSTTSSAPVLTGRLGLNWQPPTYPNLRVFVGGQLDYFWDLGRNGSFLTTPTGYFFDSGFLLRGEWNF